MKNRDDKHRKDIFTDYLNVRQANLKITCINHKKKKRKTEKTTNHQNNQTKKLLKNKNKRKQ